MLQRLLLIATVHNATPVIWNRFIPLNMQDFFPLPVAADTNFLPSYRYILKHYTISLFSQAGYIFFPHSWHNGCSEHNHILSHIPLLISVEIFGEKNTNMQ